VNNNLKIRVESGHRDALRKKKGGRSSVNMNHVKKLTGGIKRYRMGRMGGSFREVIITQQKKKEKH